MTLAALSPATGGEATAAWPWWRGPLGNGVSPDGDPPVRWSEKENVRLKVSIDGDGLATPIVWGDRIYVLSARSLDAELHMPVCFIIEVLFTNFMKYNAESTHDISLSLGHTPEQLTVRITAFDVNSFDVNNGTTVYTTKPLSERQAGGLGLHLVQQMADTLQYEYSERRSTITFTKLLEAG